MQETAAQAAAAFTAKAISFYDRHAVYGGAYLLSQAEKYERFAAAAMERAQEEAQVAPVVDVVAVEAKPVKVRCEFYREIKRFMAIALEAGLDTDAKDRCRGAVGALLGRRIESRADLTGAEWAAMGAAIKAGKLIW